MLPQELRDTPQWLVSGEDKAPRSPRTNGALADVRDRSLYVTYDEAVAFAAPRGWNVGFALTAHDPYAVIDLDAPQSAEQQARHSAILETFVTYAELSRSGNGVHIWTRGTVPRGVRRDKVELYSSDRYMICTGVPVQGRALPISDQSDVLARMFAEMGGNANGTSDLVDGVSHLSDMEVIEMGERASNGAKFLALCRGEWEGEYPSQSEADYALMNMLAYYSKDNEQCRRLFRMSALGKREKAQRERYLNYMLEKIRAEAPPDVDFSALLAQPSPTELTSNSSSVVEEPAIVPNTPSQPPAPRPKSQPSTVPQPRFSYPPGFVGEIARYIVESSVRPVPEVGATAAIGLCAGILGRQFNISGTGLNQYIILLAKTGVGKEGGASGIERILKAARGQIPMVEKFQGPGSFASGQGMIRTLDEQPCFFSVLGEFGLVLQDLTDNANNHLNRTMRKVLLDLYTKSGKTGVVNPTAYSDKTKNTEQLYSPAMTILGESTPEPFYAGLNTQHIADGLIPRFLIIEYTGDRPNRNPNAFGPPPDSLIQRFCEMVEVVLRMQANHSWCDVQMDEEATRLLHEFDNRCDAHIREGGTDGVRQLWNRAHLKAVRIAGLLAAADRPHTAVVNAEEAQWAIDTVVRKGSVASGVVRTPDATSRSSNARSPSR